MLIKYLFDKVFAFVGLLAIFPILVIISILIKMNMPDGSVIFKQKRVGKNGKLFVIYKFRTMVMSHKGSSVSIKGENRITPLGATLRKYKLDALPELWNVLKGDMSFVGPRPDVPGYADNLSPEDKIILSLRPGITGPASLKYRNEEEILARQKDPQAYNDTVIFPDKVKINKEYIENRSFLLDLQIIIYTLRGKDIPNLY
jgi:lipopolysaccharide/colanic/teichoic acid biosynthesis glycosyltransferase